jgi:ketosteroid isomerase-like protein
MDPEKPNPQTSSDDDRSAIADVIRRWAETSAAKDIDRHMELFSEDYHSDILPTKEEMRAYWSMAMEHGLTDEMKIRFDPAEIRIDGDIARTGKVRLKSTTGGYTQTLILKKEGDGVWRIIDSYT